jgi:prepilin-type N-terminal cleavage/methylation domain-containing protein
MNGMMKNRAGFTLVEVMIALTLTAVLGAAFMGAFASQSRFFDHQEKVGAARAVSRGALNIMMSEMRMIERGGGVVPTPTNTRIELRVPYVFGMACESLTGVMTISALPADRTGVENLDISGYAYRMANGTYTYVDIPAVVASVPVAGAVTCAAKGVGLPPNGDYLTVTGTVANGTPPPGTLVFLYHKVTYEFAPSEIISGLALFRQVDGQADPEELIAPFDANARFRFFVNDAATAQDAVPATLSDITGLEIVLDALSERPNGDGTHQSVPLTTAVHFKNR